MSKVKQDSEFLTKLPTELQEKVLGYLMYDEIAKNRIVCKAFNQMCGRLLNIGFMRVEKYQQKCMKEVKAQLPRRESERRNHPLARHCDVLSAIETRLSLLSMTYMKYVEMDVCCFIPGKVIDEIYRVLRIVESSKQPPKVHELLQELRDISSMAMEYFEEKIVPDLKAKMAAHSSNSPSECVNSPSTMIRVVSCRVPNNSSSHSSFSYGLSFGPHTPSQLASSSPHPPTPDSTLRTEIQTLKRKLKSSQQTISNLGKEFRKEQQTITNLVKELRKEQQERKKEREESTNKIKEMRQLLIEHENLLHEIRQNHFTEPGAKAIKKPLSIASTSSNETLPSTSATTDDSFTRPIEPTPLSRKTRRQNNKRKTSPTNDLPTDEDPDEGAPVPKKRASRIDAPSTTRPRGAPVIEHKTPKGSKKRGGSAVTLKSILAFTDVSPIRTRRATRQLQQSATK